MGNDVCGKEGEFCRGDENGGNKYRESLSSGSSGSRLMLTTGRVSGRINDDYIILHPAIGKGSFGSVYKAVNRSTNITRAVKRILLHKST